MSNTFFLYAVSRLDETTHKTIITSLYTASLMGAIKRADENTAKYPGTLWKVFRLKATVEGMLDIDKAFGAT